MLFLNLIQGYFVPSSITCVNSMEVSYIPIAKARGFTTHWIMLSFLVSYDEVGSMHGCNSSVNLSTGTGAIFIQLMMIFHVRIL